jgi:hypothetical protein
VRTGVQRVFAEWRGSPEAQAPSQRAQALTSLAACRLCAAAAQGEACAAGGRCGQQQPRQAEAPGGRAGGV